MANLLTALRLLLILPMVWCIVSEQAPNYLLLPIVLLAIASDFFDGKIARALNTASANGMLFDHGSDFIFVTISVSALAYIGLSSPFLPILIIVAFSQYVLDSYFLFKQKQLRMSFLGKWNGVFYFGPVLIHAVALASPSTILVQLEILVPYLVWLLIASTIVSIADRAIAPLRLQG